MFVHAVYFWLRKDLSEAEQAHFVSGLQSLRSIEQVHACYIGRPASTERPVIERGYSYALMLVFTDENAHDEYQRHAVHDRFRETCGSFWDQVRIFDSVGEMGV